MCMYVGREDDDHDDETKGSTSTTYEDAVSWHLPTYLPTYLLATRELELGTTEGFYCHMLMLVFATD